jgi:O-antigen/teichoic acid export membrane protein
MSNTPASSRQKIIKDSGHYVGSSVLGQAFGLLRAVLMPVFFNPAQLGVWNVLNLILSYCPHAQLGLTNGMNKSIPMMKGVGNEEEAKNIKNSVFWINLLLSLLAMIGLLCVSFFVSKDFALPLRILSVIVLFQMIYYYYFSLLRANSQFILVSNGIFFTSVLTTVLVIALIYFFPNPIIGGLIGLGLAILVVLLYWAFKGHYVFPYKISWGIVKRCFFLGIPILGIGILESLTVSVDRIFVASSMNATQLGYYALGIMISGMVSLIPGSVASVLYSTMLERFSVNRDPKDVASLLIGPMRMMWALLVILICGIVVLIPTVITLFLPKYIPSIPVMQLLIFGSFFMSSSHVPGMFIIAVNKQKFIIILQICSLGIVLLVDAVLVYFNLGLIGIAIGTICGYIIYGIGYTSIALYSVYRNYKKVLKYVFYQVFPVLMIILTFLVLNKAFISSAASSYYLVLAIVKLILLLIFVIFYLWIVNRDKIVLSFITNELGKLFKKIRQ